MIKQVDKMEDNKIGKKIKNIRIVERLSQEEFAEILLVSRQTVSAWETGKTVPDSYNIKRICEEFNINADDLIETEKSEEPANKVSNAVNKSDKIRIQQENERRINLIVTACVMAVLFLVIVVMIILIVISNSDKISGLVYITDSKWNVWDYFILCVFAVLLAVISAVFGITVKKLVEDNKKVKSKSKDDKNN